VKKSLYIDTLGNDYIPVTDDFDPVIAMETDAFWAANVVFHFKKEIFHIPAFHFFGVNYFLHIY
jgi:hypothetical protein